MGLDPAVTSSPPTVPGHAGGDRREHPVPPLLHAGVPAQEGSGCGPALRGHPPRGGEEQMDRWTAPWAGPGLLVTLLCPHSALASWG